jgi:formylglycine-generating enzyme required for sulfatase activity
LQVSHIFISYSHVDGDYAHKLESALKQRGFGVWIDDRIDYGMRWPQVIQEQLDTSAAVVVIMTPRSYGSKWVQNELSYAMNLQKPIFPLLLDGNYWVSVAAMQCVDVREGRLPSKRFYDRLVQVVSPRAVAPISEEKTRILVPSTSFELEMVLVPAGEFLMGSDPTEDECAYHDEQPQHTLILPDYYLAKTPVTNGQYLAFIRATDQSAPRHWESGKPPVGKEEHPVVSITWHDAMACCRWLTQVTGKSCNLPSEAEWEKGARGTDGSIYPWGSKWDAARCNSYEGGKRGTTPVGVYPDGASPYGLLDMAGNVWEWTRSAGKSYPYHPADGRERLGVSGTRVLRGGSFSNHARDVRCASRDRSDPESWHTSGGFRVCVVAQQE